MSKTLSLPLKINPSLGIPIYRQICDQVRAMIAGRRFRPDELVPPLRQVAEQLQINPMTVSKAYFLLEQEGLLVRLRGRGMAVARLPDDHDLGDRLDQLRSIVDQLIRRAAELNLTSEEVSRFILDLAPIEETYPTRKDFERQKS